MTALWARWRAELRTRLRAWIGLALVVGLAGGLVIAAAAGARRTDSAYPRFLEAQNTFDVFIGNYPDPGLAVFDPEAVERLPQVADSARGLLLYILDAPAIASADGRFGSEISRFEILEGRRADPSRVDEAVVAFTAAEQLGLEVGDTFPLIEPRFAEEAAAEGIPQVNFTVVGIAAVPGEFPPEPGSIYLTPAFYRIARETKLAEEGQLDALAIRLERGSADLAAFQAGLERLSGGRPFFAGTQELLSAQTRRAIHVQAVALWLLAGLVALVALLVTGQALARQARLESSEHSTLSALGMTRHELWALGMARAGLVALVAAGVAVGVALALSPLLPRGLAKTAEPHTGFAFDVTTVGLGGAATVLVVLLLAAAPAWRAARARRGRASDASVRPFLSLLADTLARAHGGPSLAVGVRMALAPGRGRKVARVRTTLSGVTAAVAAVAVALTFGASLERLLDTPRLYGYDWDLTVSDYGVGSVDRRAAEMLGADPRVEEFSLGVSGVPLDVGGREVQGQAFEAVQGDVLPPIVEGREPSGTTEIALGSKTMRALELEIGDSVHVGVPGGDSARLRVVGRAVLPALVGNATLGEGALLTLRTLRQFAPYLTSSEALIRLAPGAAGADVVADLQELIPEATELVHAKPTDLVNFGRVRSTPLILAGIAVLLGVATLAHQLGSAVRRRRSDFAVLNAIGFARRQLAAAVAWQAATIASVALVAGIPLGVAAGRWAWTLFASELGLVADPVVPLARVLLVVPAALLAVGVVALLPALEAARIRPAAVLRTE